MHPRRRSNPTPFSPPAWRDRSGFTIIEVLAASLIVMLLGLAVATGLVTQAQAGGDDQLHSQAELVVNQNQDRLRGETDQTLAGLAGQGSSTRTVSATGTSFTVVSSVSVQDASGNSSCTSSSIDYFRISTKVTWSTSVYGGATRVASADSLLARPVTGLLEASTVNQLGAPLAGASVTVTPTGTTSGSAQSQSTDSSGCVVLAALSPGTYAVTATLAGYVNSQDQSTASSSVAVTATGSVAQTVLTLGLAGSLSSRFLASASSAAPTYPGQADALTYTGNSSPPSPLANTTATRTIASPSTSLLAGQTGLTTTTSLYPWFSGTTSSPSYQSNYSAYAGQCSFQNPFPSGSTTTNLGSVSPGASATATIQEPFLYMALVSGLGLPITPRDIVLTYSAGGCTDQYAAAVATGSGGASASGVTYGQTVPANGWLADPGQPYAPGGDLTVCVDVLYNGGFVSGTATVPTSLSLTARNVVPLITVAASGACPGITS